MQPAVVVNDLQVTGCNSPLFYAIGTMKGTAKPETRIATENIMVASLSLQGKRRVQCFVFSNNVISMVRNCSV
jgi:hypothetical protein